MVRRPAKHNGTEGQIRKVERLWRRSGRTESTIAQYSRWVRRYQVSCARRGLDASANLTARGVAQFARQYVGPRVHRRNCPTVRSSARFALRAWSWGLRLLGYAVPEWLAVTPEPAPLPTPLQEYAEYRQRHRGVALSTLPKDIDTATAFLAVLRSRHRSVATARVADIDAFVARLAQRVSTGTVADACSSLRAFLRFLHATGRVRRDLAACVVAPRVRRASRPPRALPWADVRRILRSVDRTRPRGRRDFAALLLMASYGLGAAEVCGLRLEDIDWGAGVLRVRRAKTGVLIELPLMPPVARALAAYVRHERPRHAIAREVFVSAQLPHVALTGSAVGQLVRKHARAAGVTAEFIGSHALRHSHASRQIDLGAPPKIVGYILGHRHPSSTSVYVRVATTRLRSVGLTVPG